MDTVISRSNQYSVDIRKIDDEHKKLIEILNKISDAVKTAQDDAKIEKCIDDLVDYTIYHFKTEEELMSAHFYPDFEKHKAQHDKFTRNILEYKQLYSQVKQYSASKVLEYLKNWIITHILASDKEYAHFLTSNGVS